MEAGEELGFALGDGVGGGAGEAGKGGGAGVYGVDVVPDGGWAHAAERGEDPRDEEAVLVLVQGSFNPFPDRVHYSALGCGRVG